VPERITPTVQFMDKSCPSRRRSFYHVLFHCIIVLRCNDVNKDLSNKDKDQDLSDKDQDKN